MQKAFVAARAFVYMTGFIALWIWIAINLQACDYFFGFALPAWMSIPGIVLMVCGGTLALICVIIFAFRGSGTPAPFDPPREFVPGGPYRYVRNPMILGVFVFVSGLGLYLNSVTIILFSFILLILAHLYIVFREEPELERRFGQKYLEYKKSVNRWIPR